MPIMRASPVRLHHLRSLLLSATGALMLTAPARAVDVCDGEGICTDVPAGPFYVESISGYAYREWDENTFDAARPITRYELQAGSLLDAVSLKVQSQHPFVVRGGFFGAGAVRLSGGYIDIAATGTVFEILDGQGVSTHTMSNTHEGGTELAGATLTVYDDASFGSGPLTLNGGELWLDYSGNVRGFHLASDTVVRLDASEPTMTINSPISGDGRLTLAAWTGSFELAAENTHTGGTYLQQGTLSVATDGALGAPGAGVTLGENSHLIASASFASSERELHLEGSAAQFTVASGSDRVDWNGTVTGSGGLVKSGAGTLALNGVNTYTGGTRVTAGTLELSHDSGLGAADTGVTLENTAALRLGNGFSSSARTLELTGTHAIEVVSGTAAWTGSVQGSGSFSKTGSGVLELSGPATHTGHTFVSGGTLRTTAVNVLSAGSALFLNNGAILDLAGHDQTVGDFDSYNFSTLGYDNSTVILGGATVTNLNRVTNNWAGSLTGSGTFVKQGADVMNWSGANTYTGTLRIEAGTVSAQTVDTLSRDAVVAVSSGATLALNDYAQTVAGLTGSGSVTLGSATLTVAQTTDGAFSGVISGTGSFVKTGAGTFTLDGAGVHTGATIVEQGALVVTGVLVNSTVTVNEGATLAGSGTIGGAASIESGAMLVSSVASGALTFSGGLGFDTGALLVFDLDASAAPMYVTGGELMGPAVEGGLTLLFANSAHLVEGVFTLIDFTGATLSDFDLNDLKFGTTDTGFDFALSFDGTTLVVQVTATPAAAVPEPASFAAIFGTLALGFAIHRSRRHRKE